MKNIYIKETEDGSDTLYSQEYNASYHSMKGAHQESMHVFIQAGLHHLPFREEPYRVLEFGFGTGLNALLSLQHSEGRRIDYHGIELHPVDLELSEQVISRSSLAEEQKSLWRNMHDSAWNESIEIRAGFQLCKLQGDMSTISLPSDIDMVYYDAFAPSSQPKLWTPEQFKRIYASMRKGAVLTTYCVKGDVRRAMLEVGFRAEKLPGPPGKREMLRAFKD